MPNKQARSLKIRGKIALGYFMILLMFGLFLLIVASRISDLEQETVYLSDHDIEVHELTYLIEKNVLDMETGQRGYALTGEAAYLEPYSSGLEEWGINYTKLSGLIADNPVQLQNLSSIKEDIEYWIHTAGQSVIDMKRNGQDEEVAAFFRNDAGKLVIDSIRSKSDYFRDNERRLTNERISNLEESNNRLLLTMYILWGLVALLALLITYLISASIINPLKQVIRAINDIAFGGNRSERIRVRTMDEIYDLAEATNNLLDTVQQEQWSSEQLAAMSMMLQETTDLQFMCRTFMNKLSTILEMQYGAIFVADSEDNYRRAYSYAGAENKEFHSAADKVKPGEGLAGQCAVDKRIIVLDQLPPDYILVKSGLGRTAPRYAVIAPILFENKTIAILEVASLTKWQPYHFDLLSELLNTMGVTLNSAITRMEIQKLYHDSQIMNEELQTQSEELQVQSEELLNHTNELLMLNQELENQKSVAEDAAVELAKYNEQLELSSRYKSEFLANMSHELRTPLNSMLILSQLLVENRNNTLNEEEQGYASVIHSSGSDLLVMINDILDLSKVEAGKMQVEIDAVNLTELPSMLQGFFGKTADKENLAFSVKLGDDVPDLFYTDEMKLHQILRNLLSNAFKFTEKGYVEVEITRLEAYSDTGYHSSVPVICFAIKDSGIGVSEQNRNLIFEAFQQADGSTARRFGGTGLGLSISLQLAKLLDGHISLQSEEGRGSIFTLVLPCRVEEIDNDSIPLGAWSPAAATSEREAVLPPKLALTADKNLFDREYLVLQGRKVLIVDDDLRNIYALQKGLEPYQMNILTAQTGFECLQVVREQPDIDIVLLDIMMPNLDGYDTLSIIREEMHLTDLLILAISAKTMKEDRERCLTAGASDFMSKPVVLQDVVTRMCRLISNQDN